MKWLGILISLSMPPLVLAQTMDQTDESENLRALIPLLVGNDTSCELAQTLNRNLDQKGIICNGTATEVCGLLKKKAATSLSTIRASIQGQKDTLSNLSFLMNRLAQPGFMGKDTQQSVLQNYLKVLQGVQQQIDAKFAAAKVNPADFQTRVGVIKDDLIQRIKKYPSFNGTPALQEISQLKFILPTSPGLTTRQIMSFYENCGIDGLSVQATVDPGDHSIIVCPGFLLMILNQGGDATAMDVVLGHEMAHPIDALGRDLERKNLAYMGSYRKYFDCLKASDSAQLADIRRSTELDQKYFEFALSCEKILSTKYPKKNSETAIIQQIVYRADHVVQDSRDMAKFSEEVSKKYGIPINLVSHSREISADLMGRETLADLVKHIPVNKRPSYLLSNIALFCPGASRAPDPVLANIIQDCASGKPRLTPSEKIEMQDDGLHPINQFRLNSILNDSRVREGLGCPATPKPGTHPSCTI